MSQLKAAFIGPCIGVGGGDALMASLIRSTHNIKWVGAAIPNDISKEMVSWTEKGWDYKCPIHTCSEREFSDSLLNITNHETPKEAIVAACKDANIIVNWCYNLFEDFTNTIDIPVIEYAQNSDKYAKSMVEHNKKLVHYTAACSEAAAEIFDEKERVTIIYNGIEPNRVSPRKGRSFQRKVWAIPDEAKVVMFMGRFVDEKNPLDIISALTRLPNDYIAIFVGQGYGQTELYKVAQAMMPYRVAFVDPQYHVGDILAAADVFVLPSDFEGHPLALMEAMLSGTPCVYTDFSVMKELHRRFGPLGIMVERGADLAPAIQVATSENDGMKNMVRTARTIVWEHFTISAIAAIWEEFLHACVNDWWRRKYLIEIRPVSPREPMESVINK